MNASWGNQDEAIFVTKFTLGGNSVLYSTFAHVAVGAGGDTPLGQPYNAGVGVAVDGSGSAYVAGQGASDFTTTTGAFKTANAGGTDAAAFKLTRATLPMTLTANLNPAVYGQQ